MRNPRRALGATTTLVVHRALYGQVDSTVQEASRRSLGAFGERPAGTPDNAFPDPPASGGLQGRPAGMPAPPGQLIGTVAAHADNGVIDSALVLRIVNDEMVAQSVPADVLATLGEIEVADHRQARTFHLGDLGDYRIVTEVTRDGSVVITSSQLSGAQEQFYRIIGVLGAVIVLLLAAAGWAGAVIVRRTLRPLSRVADTASRVSQLKLPRGEPELTERVPEADTDPRTEVGKVGAAFNRILDHVGSALEARHASEMQVRQFVADASHELRTPLAAEQVDLSMLVVDAVSDAHATSPGHDWQLDLPAEPVSVAGDPARLHQVLANLLANARTHTPQGTTVTVGVAADGDGAVLRVVDEGPGIPAELLPHVFERFARGDSSRSRAAGSTGLGLAIVAAVVAAHNGRVTGLPR